MCLSIYIYKFFKNKCKYNFNNPIEVNKNTKNIETDLQRLKKHH